MLFYNQIKREFTKEQFRLGQIHFRRDRVTEVQLEGNHVAAEIYGSETQSFQASLRMIRGTIAEAVCSCSSTRCEHLAALCIWVVEKGSLLRSGVLGGEDSDSARNVTIRDSLKAATKPLEPTTGDPAVFIRGIFVKGEFKGISAEPAIRFKDPATGQSKLVTTHYLIKQPDFGVWKTTQGVFIKLTRENIPILESVTAATLIYQGQAGLDILARILAFENKSQVVFHEDLEGLKLDPEPLQLISLRIGTKVGKTRSLSYEFKNSSIKIDSDELKELAKLGRLSGHTVWKGQKVYRFGTSLITLSRYANRSGVAANEDQASQLDMDGFGSLYDHEEHPLHPLAAYRLSLELGVEDFSVDPTWLEFHDWLRVFEQKKLPTLPRIEYGFDLRGYQKNGLTWLWSLYHRGLAALLADDMGLGKTHQTLAFLTSLYHGTPPLTEKDLEKPIDFPGQLAGQLAGEMPEGADPGIKISDNPYRNPFATEIPLAQKAKGRTKPKKSEKNNENTDDLLEILPTKPTKKLVALKPSLVVAPTSVIAAWIQKLRKYDTRLKWHVFHGNNRVLPDVSVQLVLTTYGVLQRELNLREKDWHVVVLDEAQAIKNASTLNFRASKVLKSRFRIAMTGTPVENQSTDLWSLMEFLLPGYLGSLARFKRLYGSGSDVPTFEQAEALKRLVSPFLLRRTKSQVLRELPEKTEEIVTCEMTKIQTRAYRAVLNSNEARNVRENLEGAGKIDYANILALLTRLKQICDHPKLAELTSGAIDHVREIDPTETGKWEAFEELLNEALGSNLKVVVFTQYLGMIDMICHYLKGKNVGYVDFRGDTPDRAARLDQFAADEECKVFVCSLLAGGLGIDLTAASVCIHLDRWWNPAKENQATDRLHRIGQTRGVQVFKLQIPGTVEDRIAEIIQSKVALSGALIQESRVGLKTFSRRELLDLLTGANI